MGRAVLTQEVPLAATAAPVDSAARKVWGAFGLLMILVSVPLYSTVLPPLFDYPNHLARMHILREGGDAFYAVRWAPLPNLAQDLIVPALARIMPLESAAKLFLVITFGLLAGGTIWLNRVATGVWRPWPLLAFLLLYNRAFLWGFVNYLFGLGAALCGTALWLALERRRSLLRALAGSFVALACYFSHIAAFGLYALLIFGVEMSPMLAEFRARRWRALGYRIARASAQFVIPIALLLTYWHRSEVGTIAYAFWRKADLLFSVFDNYNFVFDAACFALFLSLFGWLGWMRRLQIAPRLGWSVSLVLLAYLAAPSQMLGGSGADHRLPVAMFLLLIAASAPRFPDRRSAVAIAMAAAALLAARLAVIEHVWRKADRVYSTDLVGIDALPRGAKLALALPAGAMHMVAVPLVHLPVLAIARREAFAPTLFAYRGQQPITLAPFYASLANAATPQQFWAAVVDGDTAEWARLWPVLRQYDFIAVTGDGPVEVPSSRCLEQFFGQRSFQIFAIVHDPRCSGPGG